MCIFLAAAFTLNAQDYAKKGIFELGGLVMYANNTFVLDGETEFDIGTGQAESVSINFFFVNMPLSYFVIDGLQIGVIPEYVSVGLDVGGDVTLSTLGIYFASAYNFNLKSSVYPFIQGRFGYNHINLSASGDNPAETGDQDLTFSGIGWGFSGGIKIQIAKGALLSLGVGYQQRTTDPDSPADVGFPADYDLGRVGLNVIVVQAGFSVFLGR